MVGETATPSYGSGPAARLAALGDRLRGLPLDALVAALGIVFMIGVTLDIAKHAQGFSFADEGFLTPEHSIFYGAFVVTALLVGVATYSNRYRGESWIDAVPTGYGWAIVGFVVFGLNGPADYLWHLQFGVEEGFEGLLSPTHLMLATGSTIFMLSPIRAAWYRGEDGSGLRGIPIAVAASLMLAHIVLFAPITPSPVHSDVDISDVSEEISPAVAEFMGTPMSAMESFIVFPLMLLGAALVLSRRFDLPPGAITIAFLGPAILGGARGGLGGILGVLVAGVVGDVLNQLYPPVRDRALPNRVFGIFLPVAFLATVHGMGFLVGEVDWTVHEWVGSIVVVGLAGWLLSFGIAPDPDR